MDGNKKIKALVYSIALVISIAACGTKNTSYSGLYIDSDSTLKFSEEIDTIESGTMGDGQMKRNDSVMRSQDQKNIIVISSDSAYSQRLIYENTYSLIRNQSQIKESEVSRIASQSKAKDSVNKTSLEAQDKELKEFQKQVNEDNESMYLPDSTFTLTRTQKLQIVAGKSNTEKDSVSDSKVNSKRNQIQKTDTVYVISDTYKGVERQDDDFLKKEESKAKNDSLEKRMDFSEDNESMYLSDSTLTLTREQKLQVVAGKSKTEKDSINETKVNSEENQIQKTDTVFVIRQINKDVEKQGNDSSKEEDAKTENESLKKRIERLESSQNNQEKREPIYIQNETPAKQTERTSDQKVESTYREIVRYEPAQRQTTIQPTVVSNSNSTDTVYIEKEVPVRETIVLESRSDEAIYDKLNSQKDSIEYLKDRLTQNELLQRKTDTIYKINEVLVYKTKEVDSVSVTTFYEIGKIMPANNVLDELKEILQSRPVEKVMLSGYTDASGNQSINKALTDRRLDYLKEFISKFVLLNKIYVQNFGDTFASSEIIPQERRVEITVYSKPNNEQSKIEK